MKKIIFLVLVIIAICNIAYAGDVKFEGATYCLGACSAGTAWSTFTLSQTTKLPVSAGPVGVTDGSLTQRIKSLDAGLASTECGPFTTDLLCTQEKQLLNDQGVEVTSTQAQDYAIGKYTTIYTNQIVRDKDLKTGFMATLGRRAGTAVRQVTISCFDDNAVQYGEAVKKDSAGVALSNRENAFKCADFADPNGIFWCAGAVTLDPAILPEPALMVLGITANGVACSIVTEEYYALSGTPLTTEITGVALVDGDSVTDTDLAIIAVDDTAVPKIARLAIYNINSPDTYEYVLTSPAGTNLFLTDVANQPSATSADLVLAVGYTSIGGIFKGLEVTANPDTAGSETTTLYGVAAAPGDGVWFYKILQTGENTVYGGLIDLTGIQPAKPILYSPGLLQYNLWDDLDDPFAAQEIDVDNPYIKEKPVPDEDIFEVCIASSGETYGVQCSAATLVCDSTGVYSPDTIVSGSIVDLTAETYGQESKLLAAVLQPPVPDGTMTVALWAPNTDLFETVTINTAWGYDAGIDGGPTDVNAIVTQFFNDNPLDHKVKMQVITAFDPPNATGWGNNNVSFSEIAENPNGTTRFTTNKQVVIQTMHPDINILGFRLDFQAFNGTFDTSAGDCTNCSFDLDNTTCQAEVEKVWGMFQQYNLTMTLSTATAINLSNLTMYCRDANQTVTAHANCAGLFSTYGVGSTPCMVWVATPGRSWTGTFFGGTGLAIDLTGFTSANLTLGTMTPTATCEQIACEIRGTWQPGNTQEFTMNKTITVTAI